VIEARNLPSPEDNVEMARKEGRDDPENYTAPSDAGFWSEPWEGMTEEDESWERNYGFYIEPEDVDIGR